MNDIDRLLARAQVGLAFLTAIGFFVLLGILLFHGFALNQAVTDIVTSLLGVLGTIFTLQMNYFYARHRPQTGEPVPTNPTQAAPPPGVPS